MSKRTTEAYESVFNYINDHLIPLRGEAIIIDFEKGIRRALIKVLRKNGSTMIILGCWFHFSQAIRRKLAQMPGLFAKVQSDEKFKEIFRRFQCLPLLPLKDIEITFRELCKEALRLDKGLFTPFINYFYNEWMKIVTPYHFCVYMRGKRTTADAESFNKKVNQLFKTHGGFFLFCETLQKLEASTSNQLMNYVNETQQKDTRNAYYQKRSKLITKIMIDYKENPKLMLKMLANPKNKIIFADNDITVEAEDVEMSAGITLYGNDDTVIYKEISENDESDYDNNDNADRNFTKKNSLDHGQQPLYSQNHLHQMQIKIVRGAKQKQELNQFLVAIF